MTSVSTHPSGRASDADIVIGGGSVGLMLASELRLGGAASAVLERLPEISEIPRAAGFLLKNIAPADIVAAIQAVHSDDGSLPPAIARRLIALVAEDPGTAARQEQARRRLALLTPASSRARPPSPRGTPTPPSPPSYT